MLVGSLRTFPIDDLFAWLVQRAPAGVLKLEHAAVSRVFHLDGGAVTFGSSNVPGEQLSQLLLGRRLIEPAPLAEAFGVQGETGVLVGKILVMTGALTEDVVREALTAKIRESIYEALTWTAGSFRFQPGRADASSELAVAVPLAAILGDGAEQVERRRALRQRLPGDDATFWLADRTRVPADPELASVLDGIARGLTINQMVLEHHGNRLSISERLVGLLDAGALKVERRTRARPPTEGELDAVAAMAAASGRAAGGDREGAWRLGRAALERNPESGELREFCHGLERGLVAELTRELLSTFSIPRLAVEREALAGESFDDAERYVIGRIDGRWDLLSLLRVVPLSELDALLAVRHLAARGLISL